MSILTQSLQAQTSLHRATQRAPSNVTENLTTTSLKADGLTYAREIDRIYWGDFDHVHLDRNGLEFGLMMSSYMQDFGVVCASVLPQNKVEIMAQECAEESYWVNGYGVERPFSRTCSRYRTYGTGVYADPELYNATQFEDGKMATAMLGQLGSTLTKTGDAGINAAMGNYMQSRDIARQAGEFKSDLQQLLHNNACGGAPLKRLQKNLIAYATGKPPIRMTGIPAGSGPFRDSDYQTLLDDLVSEQSKVWMLNRFVSQSISNVSVKRRDTEGRPLRVNANYAYVGMRGRTEGSVELQFEDGAPHCLVFSDVPDACRAVSHSLAAAYEDGKYVTAQLSEARTYVAPDLRQVEVVAGRNQPVVVEVPGKLLSLPQGRVFPVRGKLLQDVQGLGPGGGSVVMVRAGSPVRLSVFNSTNGTEFHLAQVGDDQTGLHFSNTSRKFDAGANALPRDGSPLRVSFDVPPNIRTKMPLTEYEKQKTAVAVTASTPPVAEEPAARAVNRPVNSGVGGSPRQLDAMTGSSHVLPAGTLLQLQFANAITVDQVTPGKLFPATVVAARPAGRGETLPNGTTVFVQVTQGNGNQYLIRADHAIVRGANIPLDTNVRTRLPMRGPARNVAVPPRVWGAVRIPPTVQTAGPMLLVAAETVIPLITKSNASLDGAPQ